MLEQCTSEINFYKKDQIEFTKKRGKRLVKVTPATINQTYDYDV
jgi:hypothetical protein